MDRLPEHPASPWHAGERALQERFNVAERLAVLGRQVIRDYMPEQHREFFQQLPFMVVGAVDADNRPWATLLEGPEGFVTSADTQHLFLAAHADPQDPAAAGLRANQAIGLLGTLITLFSGLITMGRGGEFNQRYGNKLMRARVYFQGFTVIVFVLLLLSMRG